MTFAGDIVSYQIPVEDHRVETKAVVPHLGSWIRTLRTPLVQGSVFWGALGAFVLVALWRIWATDPQEASDE
jgi:signal peptidase